MTPSPFASTQLAPLSLHRVIASTTACASGLGAVLALEDRRHVGPHQPARVGGRRGVRGAEHGGRRVLGPLREVREQPVDALRAALRPAVVAGGEVLGRLVVPVDEQPVGRVDVLRVLRLLHDALPLVLPAPVDRQVVVDALAPHGQPPGRDEGDVLRVGVERVERLRRRGRRADEVLRGPDAAVREILEEDLVVRLAAGAGALLRQRDDALGAGDARVADHRAVDRAAEAHLGALVAQADRPRLDRLHLAAAALVDVLRARAAAELLRVGVDDVAVGRGERPRELAGRARSAGSPGTARRSRPRPGASARGGRSPASGRGSCSRSADRRP